MCLPVSLNQEKIMRITIDKYEAIKLLELPPDERPRIFGRIAGGVFNGGIDRIYSSCYIEKNRYSELWIQSA